MWGVLAIVVSMATSGTYGVQYSENVFEAAYEIYPDVIEAELINAENPIILQKPLVDEYNSITLYTDASPLPTAIELPPRMKVSFCGNHNGICLHYPHRIPKREVGCKIVSFRWVTEQLKHESENWVTTYFLIHFQYGYKQPFGLVVPMFEKPTQTSSDEPRWAKENKVVILDQYVEYQLWAALLRYNDRTPVQLDFRWLSNVVSYGVFKNTKRLIVDGKELMFFVTRPVLMTKEMYNPLFKVGLDKNIPQQYL